MVDNPAGQFGPDAFDSGDEVLFETGKRAWFFDQYGFDFEALAKAKIGRPLARCYDSLAFPNVGERAYRHLFLGAIVYANHGKTAVFRAEHERDDFALQFVRIHCTVPLTTWMAVQVVILRNLKRLHSRPNTGRIRNQSEGRPMNPSPSAGAVLVFAGAPDLEADIVRRVRAAGFAVTTTSDENEWRAALAELRPVAAVLVVDSEDGGGFARVREARAAAPGLPVVAVAGLPDVEMVVQLLRLGVADFVDRRDGSAAILAAVERVTSRAVAVERPVPRVEPYVHPPTIEAPRAPVSEFRVSRAGMPDPTPSRSPISTETSRGFSGLRPPASTSAPAVAPTGSSVLEALAGRRGAGILAKATMAKDPSGQTVVTPTPQVRTQVAPRTADEMPVMDAKLGELQEMMAQPDCPVEDVERFVIRDPALVVAILKMANSAYFRSPRLVTNIREACVRLGNRQVFALLLESLLRRTFTANSPAAQGVFEAMWKNAALTARVARRLAEWQRTGRPEDAYVAALLHNLGEFVLVWRIVNDAPADLMQRLADEAPRIALEHETLGALAAQKWGLPPQVQALAGDHHRKRRGELPQDTALRLSIVACWALSRSVGGDYLPNMAPADALALFDEMELPDALRQRIAEECFAALEGL